MNVVSIFLIIYLFDLCSFESVNLIDVDEEFEVTLYESNTLLTTNRTNSPAVKLSLSVTNRLIISANFSEAPVDYFDITIQNTIATNFSIKITGIMSKWHFYARLNCSNQYTLKNNSTYIGCISFSSNESKVFLNESRLLINETFFWWESFNGIQLEFEGKTDLEITSLKVFGWPKITKKCNCFYLGVKDVSVPCNSESKCICKEGFNNPQCSFSQNTALPVSQNYGPFDNALLSLPNSIALSNVSVFIGPYYCIKTDDIWISTNFTTCIATMDASVIGIILPIKLCWEKQCLILDGAVFIPKVAPQIVSYDRNKTILSGGLKVNVSGTNLDSIQNPILYIIACPEITPKKNCIYFDSCNLKNSSKKVCKTDSSGNKLTCYSPSVFLSKSEIDHYIFYYSLYFNKFDRKTTIIPDPNIPDMVPKTQNYEKGKYYQIMNTIFVDCCQLNDYSVKVGGEDVDDIYVITNFLSFLPPHVRPTKSIRDLSGASYVQVIIGEHETTVGYIQYDSQFNYAAAIGGGIGSLIGVALIILIIFLMKRKHSDLPGTPLPPKSLLDKLDEPLKTQTKRCLVLEDQLEIHKLIGKGNFGQVHQGIYKGKEVAIKMLSNSEASFDLKKTFLEEAVMMMDFNHPNVLTLIAITMEKDVPKVILPFMKNGDLRSFLIKFEEVVTLNILLKMVRHVVSGMEYLASMCFVHRDLAARNCVVDGDLNVKVADFGLARDIYRKFHYQVEHSNIPLPFQWMAIECLDGKLEFSQETDVWSFGILMWEVYTKGDVPYFGMDHQKLKTFLRSERRLPKPQFATDTLYGIMLRCWARDSSKRPTFRELKSCLEDTSLENVLIEFDETDYTKSSIHPSYPDVGYLTASSLNGDNIDC